MKRNWIVHCSVKNAAVSCKSVMTLTKIRTSPSEGGGEGGGGGRGEGGGRVGGQGVGEEEKDDDFLVWYFFVPLGALSVMKILNEE